MNRNIRILVVDEHDIVREGLRAFIDTEPDLELVGEAENGHEAVLKARSVKPDVILMDLVLPCMDGLEAIYQIKRENKEVKILVLTFFSEDAEIFSAIEMGADAYIMKDSLPQELLLSIREVYPDHMPSPPTEL